MGFRKQLPTNQRRLAPSDLLVNRAIGAVALLAGAVLCYSLVFTPFDQSVRFQWEVTSDGGRTPMTHVTCPSPWSVLVEEAEPDVVTTEGLCVMPSRGLLVEGVIVIPVALAIAIWFFTRTTRPGPLHDLPVSRDRERRGAGS